MFRSQYWTCVSRQMQDIRAETMNNLRKGTIRTLVLTLCKGNSLTYMHTLDFSQPNASSPAQDISDLSFWDVDYRFMTNTVVADETMTFAASGVSVSFPGENNYTSSVFNLSSNNASPNVWLASRQPSKVVLLYYHDKFRSDHCHA